MNKTNLPKVGSTIDVALLNFVERVDKETKFEGSCTHVNILIPERREIVEATDREYTPVILHAGDAIKRYSNFDKSKVIANPTISAIFYSR